MKPDNNARDATIIDDALDSTVPPPPPPEFQQVHSPPPQPTPPKPENPDQMEESSQQKQQPISSPLPPPPPAPAKAARGSGSYPTMIRARTANRNKITKRNSESSVILTGGVYTGKQHNNNSPFPAGENAKNKRHHHNHHHNHRHPPHKKKSVYSRANRRKSLENLGLVVRNRCGSAKLQWPTEKAEGDAFELLPEGCLQVRQLRFKTPKCEEHKRMFGGGYLQQKAGSIAFQSKSGTECHSNHCQHHGNCNQSHSLQSLSTTNNNPEDNLNSSAAAHPGLANIPSLPLPKMDWKNKHNISVIVRIRPKQAREVAEKSIVFRTDSKTIVFDPKEKTKDFYFQGVKQSTRSDFGRKRPNRNVCFQFDKVYGPEATNKQIFNDTLRDLTDHLIEGFNSTVFAYGATGSGKTYTMIGSNSNPGLIVLMVEALYKRIGEINEEYDCDVACSYLEVYNETIKDLLKPEKELFIREDGKKGIIIPELTFYKPRGPNELLRLLRNGNRARTQHATDLNAESSRSHAVFEVKLCLKKKNKAMKNENMGEMGEGEDFCEMDAPPPATALGCDLDDDEDGLSKIEVIHSKLVMVDLAGSERGASATPGSSVVGTGNVGGFFMEGIGARQREGASINKSLLALANCISALADGKCHIPYRNSKLTRLLKDALSGNCTTVMIANISNSSLTSEDTYNTLKYADRAKNIVGPGTKHRNVFLEDLLMEDSTKVQVAELQAKVIQLSEMLEVEKQRNDKIRKECGIEYPKQVKLDAESLTVRNSTTTANKPVNERKPTLLEEKKNVCGSATAAQHLGGGDADGIHNNFDNKCRSNSSKQTMKNTEAATVSRTALNQNEITNSNVEVEDKQLPKEIQKYLHLIKDRARIYSEYVQFASNSKLNEWTSSCKKLKADMADILGTLSVSDENYVNFCKLKNEVNNLNLAVASRSSSISSVAKSKKVKETPQHIQHKKYAMKLKNMTEKLELLRLECVANNLLSFPDGNYIAAASSSSPRQENSQSQFSPTVSVTLEEYLQFKRLVGEQEGNDRMEQFYQQFSQQITNQLITSGMTLMHALKIIKRLLHGGMDPSTATALQQEYKELSDFVYGQRRASEVFQQDAIPKDNEMEEAVFPHTINKLPPLPHEGRPPSSNLGRRRNNLILEDLHKLKKLVDQPLLIQLTSLLGADEEEEDDDDDEVEDETDFGEENIKEIAAEDSSSRETLLHSDPEQYEPYPQETDYNPSTPVAVCPPASLLVPNSSISTGDGCVAEEEENRRRRRRLWTDTDPPCSTAYINESLASTALPPPPPPFSMQSFPSTAITSTSNIHPALTTRQSQTGQSQYYCEEEGNNNADEAKMYPTVSHPVPRRSRTSESRRSQQQHHKSDYDWYTTSTATSEATGTNSSSSASTSVENIMTEKQARREGSLRKDSSVSVGGNRKHLDCVNAKGQHEKTFKEDTTTNTVASPEKNTSSSNKYTYRLESPSEVMQAYSRRMHPNSQQQANVEAAEVKNNNEGDEESDEDEDEVDDDDDEEESDDDVEDEECEEEEEVDIQDCDDDEETGEEDESRS